MERIKDAGCKRATDDDERQADGRKLRRKEWPHLAPWFPGPPPRR